MKFGLALIIFVLTGLLVVGGWVQSGGMKLRAERTGSTPDEAVRAFLSDVQARNWDRAFARLDHSNDIQQPEFVREIAGADGSLRTYSTLQSFDIWPVHADANHATLRVKLNWSSAVGSLDNVRDLALVRDADSWKLIWPKPNFANVP